MSAARVRLRAGLPAIFGVAVVLLVLVVTGLWGTRAFSSGPAAPAVTLRDQTQLTFTGRIQTPAISPDGRQLAFTTRRCTETACVSSVEVQDVGGSTTRRVLDDAISAYFIEWSPDRRHLLVTGSIDGRWGTFILSLLGGRPRHLGVGGLFQGGGATFVAGGDSLLILPPYSTDSVSWIRVANLAGVVGDSIRVVTGGRRVANVDVVPGTRWLVVTTHHGGSFEQLVMDRQGRVSDRAAFHTPAFSRTSVDAIWRSIGMGDRNVITRTPFDSSTGRLGARTDTVHAGRFSSFSVTADGDMIAYDQLSSQHSVYALELEDALAGRFAEDRRILHGSAPFSAQVSHDGRRVLVGRPSGAATRPGDVASSIRMFDGGPETTLPIPGSLAQRPFWHDSVTLAVATRSARGITLSLLDVRSGAQHSSLAIPDSLVWDYDVLPGGGWIWLPEGGEELRIHREGVTGSIAMAASYEMVFAISASPGSVKLIGWNAGTADTLRVSELSLDDDSVTEWFGRFVDSGTFQAIDDGSVLVQVFETDGLASLYHVTAPGQARLLGMIPRPITGVHVSDDLRRATVGTADFFGDVWTSRVVRDGRR